MNKAGREVIEQIEVSWRFPKNTEIVNRPNNAAAEEMMPNPIDINTGDKGIDIRIDDFLGEFEPAAANLPQFFRNQLLIFGKDALDG